MDFLQNVSYFLVYPASDIQDAVELPSTGTSSRLVLLKFLAAGIPLHFMLPLFLNHLSGLAKRHSRASPIVQTRLMISGKCEFWAAIFVTQRSPGRPVCYQSGIDDRLLWLW